jgi:hypothetical protein
MLAGELLVNLRAHLPPFITSPTFVFVCMWGGLGLLYLSHQQQLHRILTEPSRLVGVDDYRDKERPGWLLPLSWVTLAALVAAPVLALAYSLAYKGTPPQITLQAPPRICKTVDCFPHPSKIVVPKPPIVVNAPGGIPIVGNTGIVNNPVVNNFVPPARTLTTQQAIELGQIAITEPFMVTILSANTAEATAYAQTIYDAIAKVAKSKLKEEVRITLVGFGASNAPTGTVLCTKDFNSPTKSFAEQFGNILASNSPSRVLLSPCSGVNNDEIRFVIAEP